MSIMSIISCIKPQDQPEKSMLFPKSSLLIQLKLTIRLFVGLIVCLMTFDGCFHEWAHCQTVTILPAASYVDNDSQASWMTTGPGIIVSDDRTEIHLLEDKDYPKSLFEDYTKHVGQVSGIATLPEGDVVIFHRAERHWTAATFNETTHRLADDQHAASNLIDTNTIMIIDRENGSSVASFGRNLFYMPHSVASDSQGNLWMSDVARHQVMRLPRSSWRPTSKASAASAAVASNATNLQVWPDIILGEPFEPGQDEGHFCQPSELAVSSDGRLLFVADGYCNNRVKVYSATSGVYLTSFGQQHGMQVVHSLTLIEGRNLVCVADRENGQILCFKAGLDGQLDSIGEFVFGMKYPLGKVYAVLSINDDYLLISSKQANSNHYDLALLNPFNQQLKLVWTSSDLLEPHSLAKTKKIRINRYYNDQLSGDEDDEYYYNLQHGQREYVYAADLARNSYKKVFKFDVIQRHV